MGWVKTGSDRLISRWRWWGWGQKCDPRHLRLTDILISRKAFPTNKQTEEEDRLGSVQILVYKYLCTIVAQLKKTRVPYLYTNYSDPPPSKMLI